LPQQPASVLRFKQSNIAHQTLDVDRLELNTTEREDAWVKDFIGRLAGMVLSVGRRSQ
jgi:hypothetical protein